MQKGVQDYKMQFNYLERYIPTEPKLQKCIGEMSWGGKCLCFKCLDNCRISK